MIKKILMGFVLAVLAIGLCTAQWYFSRWWNYKFSYQDFVRAEIKRQIIPLTLDIQKLSMDLRLMSPLVQKISVDLQTLTPMVIKLQEEDAYINSIVKPPQEKAHDHVSDNKEIKLLNGINNSPNCVAGMC